VTTLQRTPFLSIAFIFASVCIVRFRARVASISWVSLFTIGTLESCLERYMQNTELLIIGAGPYGLSVAAHAKDSGLDVIVVGESMAFWRHNMPGGMLLRSGPDWHLDAAGVHTLEAFLEERRIPRTAEPIPVEAYRDYAEWFRHAKHIEVQPLHIKRVHRVDGRLYAECENAEKICSTKIIATPGLAPFANWPDDLPDDLLSGRIAHTSTLVEFGHLAGQRCLVIGGRQSAFEWTALMIEAGVESVDLVFRQDTPRFVSSDWSFTDALIENTLRVPGWFQRLDASEQAAIQKRFWSVGRLQLEPWLWPRVNKKNVRLWPNSRVADWHSASGGGIEARLDRGGSLFIDYVLIATGYRVDISKVSYLADEVASGRLTTNDGSPALDQNFQTTLSGLYITGQAAMRDFGPCFGFTRGCIASARIIVSGYC
jgi:FAD-dependent urate hydroxylase